MVGGGLPEQGGALADGDELLFKQKRQHGNYCVRYDKHGARVIARVLNNVEKSSKSSFIDLVDGDP